MMAGNLPNNRRYLKTKSQMDNSFLWLIMTTEPYSVTEESVNKLCTYVVQEEQREGARNSRVTQV